MTENFYKLLFEKSSDAVLIIQGNRFVDCNDATVKMLRYRSKEELLNTHPSALSPELQADGRPSYEKANEMMQLAYKNGNNRFEWLHKRADGTVFPVEVLLTFLSEGEEKILYTVWRDITERKKAESALKESEQRLKAIFDSAFQFIGLLATDGTLIKANRTAKLAAGVDDARAEVEGSLFWETPWWQHSPELQQRLRSYVERAAKGEFIRDEVTNLSADQKILNIDFSLKPVFDEKGRVLYLVAEGRDITEIKQKEAALAQIQKMEMIGTLAGGVAHDFNNILSGIVGTLSILRYTLTKQGHVETERLKDFLQTMERAGSRATQMVQQLLSLSRKQETKREKIDLHACIDNVKSLGAGSFDKSVTIRVETGTTPAIILGDPVQMEQVILNLMVNAAHAMTIMRGPVQAWGGAVSVSVTAFRADEIFCRKHDGARKGTYWKLSVKDTGVGISKENIKQIFSPFFSTKEKGKGTGLGLSIVFSIIRDHGGFVDVYSELGVGTTFNVFLPSVDLEELSGLAEESVDTIPHGSGLVLVVDDEPDMRKVAKEMLEICGYSVALAENGKEALNYYAANQAQISLVLLDMVMPVMSGDETLKMLKTINPTVKVLLTSGFKQDERVERMLAQGGSAFIQKPYSLEELANNLKLALGETVRGRNS